MTVFDMWNIGRVFDYRERAVNKLLVVTAFLGFVISNSVSAAGWSSVHKYVKRTGHCGSGVEVLASHYSLRGRTGAAFNPLGNTAAARTWPIGTALTVTNPHTGKSVSVVINDVGPFGTAYRMGTRLDLAVGAARRIGMRGAQYVCVV